MKIKKILGSCGDTKDKVFLLSLEEARDLFNMHLTMGFSMVRLSRDAGGFVRQEIMITMHPMSVVMAQLLLEEIMSPVNVELSDLRCG